MSTGLRSALKLCVPAVGVVLCIYLSVASSGQMGSASSRAASSHGWQPSTGTSHFLSRQVETTRYTCSTDTVIAIRRLDCTLWLCAPVGVQLCLILSHKQDRLPSGRYQGQDMMLPLSHLSRGPSMRPSSPLTRGKPLVECFAQLVESRRPHVQCCLLFCVYRNVALESGTERAFSGETVNGYSHSNKAPGMYTGSVGGLPLFSSDTKFDSGTGWPSFYAPLDPEHVIEVSALSLTAPTFCGHKALFGMHGMTTSTLTSVSVCRMPVLDPELQYVTQPASPGTWDTLMQAWPAGDRQQHPLHEPGGGA